VADGRVLYHYTCAHGAAGIRRDRQLVGNPHPYLLEAGPLIHLTDLERPDRYGLGLTSYGLGCDRTAYRVTVATESAGHWPVFARAMRREVRERFEACPGALPMHWWIGREPIPVLTVEAVGVTSGG
jgi:hypothetical protein